MFRTHSLRCAEPGEKLVFEPITSCGGFSSIQVAFKLEDLNSYCFQIRSSTCPSMCFEFDVPRKSPKVRPHEIPIDIHNIAKMLVRKNGLLSEGEATKIVTSVASILLEPAKWIPQQKR